MKMRILLLICLVFLCVGCGKGSEASPEDSKDTDTSIAIETSDSAPADDTANNTDDKPAEAEPEPAAEDKENTASPSTTAEEASETQPEEGSLSGRDLFADYIMGKAAASVSKDFLSAINLTDITLSAGDEYTVSELESLLQNDSMIGDTQPEVSYAPLSIHDKPLYAMQLYYETGMENLTETFIFSDNSGKLEMIFAIDAWTRRSAFINAAGVVFDSGSNGAGSHSAVTYAPDTSFIYRKVSDLDEEYYGFSFYDEEGEPSTTVNAIMNEAGEGNDKATDVVYYREIINGKRYYYFLKGAGKLTQDTVEYIDKIAKEHNFTFDGKAAADEARTAYEKELQVEEACQSEEEPHWKTL